MLHYARALYDFQRQFLDEMELKAGDIICLGESLKDASYDENWWTGYTLFGERKGRFPKTYVEILNDRNTTTPNPFWAMNVSLWARDDQPTGKDQPTYSPPPKNFENRRTSPVRKTSPLVRRSSPSVRKTSPVRMTPESRSRYSPEKQSRTCYSPEKQSRRGQTFEQAFAETLSLKDNHRNCGVNIHYEVRSPTCNLSPFQSQSKPRTRSQSPCYVKPRARSYSPCYVKPKVRSFSPCYDRKRYSCSPIRPHRNVYRFRPTCSLSPSRQIRKRSISPPVDYRRRSRSRTPQLQRRASPQIQKRVRPQTPPRPSQCTRSGLIVRTRLMLGPQKNKIQTLTCRHWKRGYCARGRFCGFDHSYKAGVSKNSARRL